MSNIVPMFTILGNSSSIATINPLVVDLISTQPPHTMIKKKITRKRKQLTNQQKKREEIRTLAKHERFNR